MDEANRQRRRAKEHAGEQEHRRRTPPSAGRQSDPWRAAPHGPSAADHAESLLSETMQARLRDDAAFRRNAALLAERPDVTGWRRAVERALRGWLERSVTAVWRNGWQPADVLRYVGRELGKRHTRMATDVIAAEMCRYAAATVDERWEDQLTSLDVRVRWTEDDRYLFQWGERERLDWAATVDHALEVLFMLGRLPRLPRIGPLPGEARRDPRRRSDADPVDQRMLDKVRALLAKAESTEFPKEAEALSARAQHLMTRHSIDDALLVVSDDDRAEPAGCRLGIDHPYEVAKARLLEVVAEANRCRAMWHKHLGFSTVLGFPTDLGSVELLFTSLLVQGTTAMLKAGSRRDALGRSRTRSYRRSFLFAYAQRIGERLNKATDEATHEAAVSAETHGKDLLPVLAARDRAVEKVVETMFPTLRRHHGGRARDREGWEAGRAAADLATLHGPRVEVTDDS